MSSNSPLHDMTIDRSEFDVMFDVEEYVKYASADMKYFMGYYLDTKENSIYNLAIDTTNLPTELPDDFGGFIIPHTKETKNA